MFLLFGNTINKIGNISYKIFNLSCNLVMKINNAVFSLNFIVAFSLLIKEEHNEFLSVKFLEK